MPPLGLGLDVACVAAWRARLRRTPRIQLMAFTPVERAWADGCAWRYATVWALKEAVVKARGTGFVGVGWRDVQIDPALRRIRVGPADAGRRGLALAAHAGHVVAVAVSVGAPVVVVVRTVGESARFRVRSALTRAAGDRALRTLVDTRQPASWHGGRGQPPALFVAGRRLPVSLAHGRGLVGAAVADPDGVVGPGGVGEAGGVATGGTVSVAPGRCRSRHETL
jgi:phosphopantetheinyl transferase (holo-ACP synthase)